MLCIHLPECLTPKQFFYRYFGLDPEFLISWVSLMKQPIKLLLDLGLWYLANYLMSSLWVFLLAKFWFVWEILLFFHRCFCWFRYQFPPGKGLLSGDCCHCSWCDVLESRLKNINWLVFANMRIVVCLFCYCNYSKELSFLWFSFSWMFII